MPRSRKVGHKYNDSKEEELGHNDKKHEPSPYFLVPVFVNHFMLYVNT